MMFDEWQSYLAVLVIGWVAVCWSMGYFGRFRAWLESLREEKQTRMARALLREMTSKDWSDRSPKDVWDHLMVRANEVGYAYEQFEIYG